MTTFNPENIYIGSSSLMADVNKNILFELNCLWYSLDEEDREKVYNELLNNNSKSGVELYYSLSIFNNLKIRDQFQTSQLNKGINRSKSVKSCPKCKNFTLSYIEKQTRSGDEGASVLEICQHPGCNYNKFNR